jgi:hypothetical protein
MWHGNQLKFGLNIKDIHYSLQRPGCLISKKKYKINLPKYDVA